MTLSSLPVVLIWAAAYGVAVVGSGPFVRHLMARAGQEIPREETNPGRVVGKLEDVLVVSFVIVEAYTALALVFAAKGIVRVEGGRERASYYILGTLANFTWALLVALAARLAVRLVR